jgi:hypothetical protein
MRLKMPPVLEVILQEKSGEERVPVCEEPCICRLLQDAIKSGLLPPPDEYGAIQLTEDQTASFRESIEREGYALVKMADGTHIHVKQSVKRTEPEVHLIKPIDVVDAGVYELVHLRQYPNGEIRRTFSVFVKYGSSGSRFVKEFLGIEEGDDVLCDDQAKSLLTTLKEHPQLCLGAEENDLFLKPNQYMIVEIRDVNKD